MHGAVSRPFRRLPARGWVLSNAVLAAVALVAGEILLSAAIDARTRWGAIALYGVLATASLAYFLVLAALTWVREARFPDHPELVLDLREAMLVARRELSSKEVEDLAAGRGVDAKPSIGLLLKALHSEVERHLSDRWFGDGAEFEAVFMTRSLEDGKVLPAAWAVRTPRSLHELEADPDRYEQTEAARSYREDDDGDRVPTRVIEDTGGEKLDYDFVSNNEKGRIRSTVLKPCYSGASRLLGFIVIHSNRRNAFKADETLFWDALLDPLAAEVAHYGLHAEAIRDAGDGAAW